MNQIEAKKTRMLNDPALQHMHDQATEIIARTGIYIDHKDIRVKIAQRTGFTLAADKRLRISPDRVHTWHQQHHEYQKQNTASDTTPDSETDTAANTLELRVGNRAAWTIDPETNSPRPMIREDVINSAKLIQALNPYGIHGTTAGIPTDVPAPLQAFEQYLIAAEFSAQPPATCLIGDIQTAQYIREMDLICGQPFHQNVFCPSPLLLAGPDLDIIWHFRDQLDSATVTSMPVMGFSGPCEPIALFTLALAECIAAAVILTELLENICVSIAPNPQPADPNTGSMVFGSPEWQFLDLMHRDVYNFYSIDYNQKNISTTASLPNVQAQIDRSAAATLGLLGGYTIYNGIGQLAMDEVFCPAQCILDLEMLYQSAHLALSPKAAPDLAPDKLLDVIDEVITANQTFAEHSSTKNNIPEQYYDPVVLKRLNRAQWLAAEKPDFAEHARQTAQQIAKNAEYQPPADILKELQKIYKHVREKIS